jgi:hypothetical protein
LRHIWGDANCGSDLVTDTPTSQTSNFGCPTFPHTTCSNGANGDMFMNYMDYTDDACMYMFSNGQNTRMQALFATGGSRASLLTSQGCVAPTTTGCATPTALAASSITTTSATLSWSAVTGVTNYTLKYKTAAATTYTSVTVTAATYALAGLTAATTYNFTVTANCGSTVSTTSAVTNFTTLATNAVTYCTSKGSSVADEYIGKVVFNTISNTSGANAGYGNFTNLSTNIKLNTAYAITITPTWTGTVYPEGFKVWIDWNKDGDFLDTGENVFTKAASTATTATGSITVPATATLGATRMRVQMKYNSSTITSCETFSYGEVEDYTVNIVSAREAAPATAELGILLYPNPTHDQMTLELTQFDGTPLVARLMNVSGAVLRDFKIETAAQQIETADLPAGMYFITVITADNQMITKKFIKN